MQARGSLPLHEAGMQLQLPQGKRMRFADQGWTNCEPSDEEVLAAAYLEAKGYEFGKHFDRENLLECAENVYQAEISMGKPE